MSKPVIIFTNFWDAEKLLKEKTFLSKNGETLYKINLSEDPVNYSVHSIALSHPSLTKMPNMWKSCPNASIDRIGIFCPTYNLLMDYKGGCSWESYTVEYHSLLKQRKHDIIDWFESLKDDHVYILCCWENTCKKANCHRTLLYEALVKSKSLKDKATYIHRDGSWRKTDNCEEFIIKLDELLKCHEVVSAAMKRDIERFVLGSNEVIEINLGF